MAREPLTAVNVDDEVYDTARKCSAFVVQIDTGYHRPWIQRHRGPVIWLRKAAGGVERCANLSELQAPDRTDTALWGNGSLAAGKRSNGALISPNETGTKRSDRSGLCRIAAAAAPRPPIPGGAVASRACHA
ncbi:hypothetical protein G3I60_22990 [Streptomyces sp. SID13666]|uniref:hypothetical protein n=1 Tax=unclassified Streptomyces TaxID=2593676 RepID=UPI0013BEE24F|nr:MULTISPECIES: hypothetical protein [unclassified Streptomyces]NEA56925.1 hypothetical protein [Streptomyces sp. SID13666]NEA77263.1 hypothetical protein [Streptomyces sp. SID13588]